MSALHSAFKSIGPCAYSDIPTDPDGLDSYLTNLFSDCQTILESVPIAEPDPNHVRSRSHTASSSASSASEISASSARSAPPAPEQEALKKEWGKPIKLGNKENPLGVTVHKTSGKDGRGAWFARRSVHEGLGFAKFKSGLQQEFPESLEVGGGKPGQGNVRGIGGERKVEDVGVKGRGRIQLWQLNAQFPGPTTPRDFITLLITSSSAIKQHHPNGKVPELTPRHYVMISRPCDHPDTQPRDGFVRGQYESIEFIREVPRKPNGSPSTTFHHDNHSLDELPQHGHLRSAGQSHSNEPSTGRQRSVTVANPGDSHHGQDNPHEDADYNPEDNPVEWIMITRSDPGGSVPRFMVERGTPASIAADVTKFLDWACQKEDVPTGEEPPTPSSEAPLPTRHRIERLVSWQTNDHMEGIDESGVVGTGSSEAFPVISEEEPKESPTASRELTHIPPMPQDEGDGMLASAVGAASSMVQNYTPQAVLNRLPQGNKTDSANVSTPEPESHVQHPDLTGAEASTTHADADEAASIVSSLSFATADSNLSSDKSAEPSVLSTSSPEQDRNDAAQSKAKPDAVQKEHTQFHKRRQTLDKKLEAVRDKYGKENQGQADKIRKAEEKHQKEVEKEEERLKKNLAKIEQKRVHDAKKDADKARKEQDRDEKTMLKRERDEARERAAVFEKQVELLTAQVGELQKQNTHLMARIGRLETSSPLRTATPVSKVVGEEGTNRSRSSSLQRAKDPSAVGS